MNWMRLSFIGVVLGLIGLALPRPVARSLTGAPTEGPLLLPVVLLEPTVTPTVTPSATPTATLSPTPTGCQPNDLERTIAERMLSHPDQAHPKLRCDPLLERFARDRARDMGARGYFSHTTPEGLGPNVLLRQAGYPLWSGYSNANTANSIEIMYGGGGSRPPNPDDPWTWWLNSSVHRSFLLGTQPFNRDQNEYGIGAVTVPSSPLGHYWIGIFARR
jgi:uncharacterized protein YkwD